MRLQEKCWHFPEGGPPPASNPFFVDIAEMFHKKSSGRKRKRGREKERGRERVKREGKINDGKTN